MDYELEKFKIAQKQMYMQMLQIALSATLLYFLVKGKNKPTVEESVVEEDIEE